MAPNAGPGLADPPLEGGHDTPAIAGALQRGELVALYLLAVDPLRDLPERAAWEHALERATTVIAHTAFLTDGVREHATVVFPAEAAAEKEGTVTHPDGRLQRLRPAIARQGAVRSEWSILAELAARLGADPALPGLAQLVLDVGANDTSGILGEARDCFDLNIWALPWNCSISTPSVSM